MKVQIISDIHLEMYSNSFRDFKSIIKKDDECNILFMAGDIGHLEHETFKPFLDYVSSNWEDVYYVLGNHEFYQINKKQSDIIPMENLQLLYSSIIDEYPNILLFDEKNNFTHIWDETNNTLYFVYGNTAWTKCQLTPSSNINDVNYIYTNNTECLTNTNLESKLDYTDDNINIYENQYMTSYDKSFVNPYRLIKKENQNELHNVENGRKMNDIKKIGNINTKWMFLKNKDFIYSDIKWNNLIKIEEQYINTNYNINVKFIVLTHFPIADYTKVSHEKYHSEPKCIRDYFCNDILDNNNNYLNKIININLDQIFISGHTHYCYNYISEYPTYVNYVSDTVKLHFISNQKGYSTDLCRYNNKCVFDI